MATINLVWEKEADGSLVAGESYRIGPRSGGKHKLYDANGEMLFNGKMSEAKAMAEELANRDAATAEVLPMEEIQTNGVQVEDSKETDPTNLMNSSIIPLNAVVASEIVPEPSLQTVEDCLNVEAFSNGESNSFPGGPIETEAERAERLEILYEEVSQVVEEMAVNWVIPDTEIPLSVERMAKSLMPYQQQIVAMAKEVHNKVFLSPDTGEHSTESNSWPTEGHSVANLQQDMSAIENVAGVEAASSTPELAEAITVLDPVTAESETISESLEAGDLLTDADLFQETIEANNPVETVLRYTSAPIHYDGFGTKTVQVMAPTDRGKEIRQVEIATEHLVWQESRYYSGLHSCLDETNYQGLLSIGVLEIPHNNEGSGIPNNVVEGLMNEKTLRGGLGDYTVTKKPVKEPEPQTPLDPQVILNDLVYKNGSNFPQWPNYIAKLKEAGLEPFDVTPAMLAIADQWVRARYDALIDWQPMQSISNDLGQYDQWRSRCQRYRVVRQKDRYVTFVKNGEGKESFLAFDEKKMGNYPKEFHNLDTAMTAVEKYHCEKLKQEKVESNRREALEGADKRGRRKLTPQVETSEPKPEKVKEAKTPSQPKQPKERKQRGIREGGPSNKEIVYKAWKTDSSISFESLHNLVGERVEFSTIRGWIGAWKRGNNLPACAK